MNEQKKQTCDACGSELSINCRIGAYIFCRRCASGTCREEALQISKHKHKEKLQTILESLNSFGS